MHIAGLTTLETFFYLKCYCCTLNRIISSSLFSDGAYRKNCSILSKNTEPRLVLFGAAMSGWGRWMKAGQSRQKNGNKSKSAVQYVAEGLAASRV